MQLPTYKTMPLPKKQKEYFLRPTVTPYTSVWDTEDHKTSQYVVPVRKPARVLPETPLMLWKSKSGLTYQIAPPYTLVVPPAVSESLNLKLPEYSWAQG